MLYPRSFRIPTRLLLLALLPVAAPTAQTLLRDIATGTDPGSTFPTGPLLDDGQKAWLNASRGNYSANRAVLVTDGTAAGTTWFDTATRTDCRFPAQFVQLAHGTVLFRARDAARGFELHASDGTQNGSGVVLDIRPGSSSSVSDQFGSSDLFTVLGNRLLFAADDGTHGKELWVSDGTAAGTSLLIDLVPGPGGSSPSPGTRVGNRVVFGAWDPASGYELFASDGTAAGTGLLVDLNPGSGGSIAVGDFTTFGSLALFTADDGTTGREPWITDGTAAGTRRLIDLAPGSSNSTPRGFTPHGSVCYFSAEAPTTGRELYVTDGTNVTFLGDLDGSRFGSGPAGLTPVGTGSDLAFVTYDFTYQSELWWTDGTPAGTRRITDLTFSREPGSGSWQLGAVGNRAVFVIDTVALGFELWASDGTTAGTGPLFDLAPGPASSRPHLLGNFGGELWFDVDDGVHGRELWTTDGTLAGTRPITASMAGFWSSIGVPRTTQIGIGNRAVFAATDPLHGRELWISDGTATGTRRVTDLAPGPLDSIRVGDSRARTWDRPMRFRDQLLFAADDGTTGIELFALPLDLLSPALVEPIGSGCPGHAGLVPQLGTTGIPARGQAFGVELSQAVPSSPATLLFGAGRQNITLPGGCVVHPRQPAIGVPAAISPAGEASLGFTIPANDPSLVGVDLVVQWAVLDPSGAFLNTLAFSPGAIVTLGES